MHFIDLIFIISIYLIISIIISLLFVFFNKSKLLFSNWFIYLIGFSGAVFGGLFDIFFGNFFDKLASIAGKINIYPSIVFSIIFILIFIKIVKK